MARSSAAWRTTTPSATAFFSSLSIGARTSASLSSIRRSSRSKWKSYDVMTKYLLFPLLLALSVQASELDRAAAALAGTEAQLTGRFTPKGFKNTEVESGTVLFGTLPMMRWSYSSPEEKLFVFDGERSWFYVPEEKQVTV